MSNISELANVPQISFIENMTLQETEEQLKAEYARIYREQTGKELVLGEADAKTLLLKAFALIEYQTMQYADIKGQAELLKTSTGEALDALVALLGLTRQESKKATAKERFLLAEARADTVAVPAGTRVKTQGGRYFNTLDYAEIPPGATYVDTIVQAEEAGAESSGILAGEINILVDPIPYIASVSNVDESTGGLDVEDDDSLTERAYLAPSRFSCAGPRDAYEYHVREWRSGCDGCADHQPGAVRDCHLLCDGGRAAAERHGAGGADRIYQWREPAPAVRQGGVRGAGGGALQHSVYLLDWRRRPAQRRNHTGKGDGGGAELPKLAAAPWAGY